MRREVEKLIGTARANDLHARRLCRGQTVRPGSAEKTLRRDRAPLQGRPAAIPVRSSSCRAAETARRWPRSNSSRTHAAPSHDAWLSRDPVRGLGHPTPKCHGAGDSGICPGQALGHTVRVTAAGRTDAGVHADAQVVSFETPSTITLAGVQRILPRWLPDDMWVVDVNEAPPASMHAAPRCAAGTATRSGATPSLRRVGGAARSLRASGSKCPRCVPPPGTCSGAMISRHWLVTRNPLARERASTTRTVFAADWLDVGPSLVMFEICADAFLKHMVRAIVGSLLWVGDGRWSPTQFSHALAARDRRAAGPTAPALGLTLHHIEY